MQNFMGMDGFIWFTGVVEDRNDPSKLGRVRVRIVGHNPDDKSIIPTKDLPWAHIMHPVTDPSMNGMGNTPSFLVEGTWVVGFFLDGVQKENPIVMGSLPGVPDERPNTSKGFYDPNGKYPRENRLGESDVNRLARSDTGFIADAETVISDNRINTDTSVENGFTDIPVAGGASFSEPTSSYAAKYPFNHVYESESGHVKEFDDTEGEERIREYHTAGSYYEVNGSGSRTVKVVGDSYHITAGSDYVYVDGHCNLTVGSNCSTYVKGDYDLRVDGNMEILVKGNKKEVILCNDDEEEGFVEQIIKSGKKQTSVDGDVIEVYEKKLSTDVQGKVTQIFAGGLQSNITGTYDIDVGNDPEDPENLGQITINTPTIDIETTTLNFDSTTSNITATTFNLDSSTSVNIKSAIINMDTASMDIDATDYQLNAGSSNLPKITVGAADAHALSPSVTSPSSASVTLPTVANELLLTPDDNLTIDDNPLATLATELGESELFIDQYYADAILRGRKLEKKEGRDPDSHDATEDSGVGAPSVFTGSTDVPTDGDYDENVNYNDDDVANSAGFKPYTKQYGYDLDELLFFRPAIPKIRRRADPRINPAFGALLEELTRRLRVEWNEPNYVLPINDAFRTPQMNRDCGGSKNSQHLLGVAADINHENTTKEERLIFVRVAREVGMTGIGLYFPSRTSGSDFIHIDVGTGVNRPAHWGPSGSRKTQYGWAKPTIKSAFGYV